MTAAARIEWLAALAALAAACGSEVVDSSLPTTSAAEESVSFARNSTTTSSGSGGKKGAAPAPAPSAAEERFTDVQVAGVQPAPQTDFPLSVRTIYISVKWSNLTGSHQQTVYLYAPGGSLWQVMDQAFATTTTAGSGQLQAEKLADGGYQTWESLPVAGTLIETYGLRGTWTAQVVLDSASAPITSASFNLN